MVLELLDLPLHQGNPVIIVSVVLHLWYVCSLV
jgi:hypothetical protein